MQIIRDRCISENQWLHVPEGGLTDGRATAHPGGISVSLSDWHRHRNQLLARPQAVGVRLGGADAVDDVAGDLGRIDMVVLEFGAVGEGRGYTQARLLRGKFSYRGEIRAIGDVSRDRLAFMERCGINAFELRPGCDPEDALAAFTEISLVYQSAADGRPGIASRRL